MNNLKIKRNILEKITVILVAIYIFFGYIINKESLQLFSTAIIAIVAFLSLRNYKLKLCTNDILWMAILLLSCMSIIYSVDKDNTIRYDICLLLVLILKVLILNFKISSKFIINCILCFSAIHVICTILYSIFPNIIQSICQKILLPKAYNYNVALMRYGANAGICSEHGFNAFCITVFINIIFVRCITQTENRKINISILCIGIIALLMTGKRGLLVANIIAMLIIFIISNFLNKKILKRLFFILILSCIILKIISYIPAAQIVFQRFKELDSAGNVLNGREVFYEKMFENINKKFMLGTGAKTTQKITGGNDGHNIYLQMLTELGIFGTGIYITIFINSIMTTIKYLKKNKKSEHSLISLYYQIFFLTYGMTGNPLYNFSILMIYFIMVNLVTMEDENLGGINNENRDINIS